MQRCRLHITGASGSGTTTLARALAMAWSAPHADADDYFWLPTDPPFTQKRPEQERVALMQKVFVPREAWLLSGSMVGWGSTVLKQCDAVIFLTLDADTRMRRLEQRERLRRGAGGVDKHALTAFFAWAKQYDDPHFEGRSRAGHEAWLGTLLCPVLRLDSSCSPETLRDEALSWEPHSR